MKTKLFISFVAFVAASVLMSGCSNDESTATTTTDQLTAFTGGVVTEVPMERVQIGTPGGSTLAPGVTTCLLYTSDAADEAGMV